MSSDRTHSFVALLEETVQTIQGQNIQLIDLKNHVILVVNTASHCGYTKQYAKLEWLYQQYKEAGLVILAFPCNDFGQQEPGTHEEIRIFCEKNYHTHFHLMQKIHVVTEECHPLFLKLKKITGEAPKWNFHKYLIGRHAESVISFFSSVEPDDPQFIAQIELLLTKKV